jgi:sulfonate transport system substrate-binding protein
MTHPTPSRRWVIAASAVVALALPALAAVPAAARSADAHSAVSLKGITIRVGGQTDGLRALLVASGVLQGKQYALKWSTFTSGPPLLEALQAGRIDLGGVGNTPPVFAAATRANFRLVAAVQQRRRAGDELLVRSDSSIRSVKDLKGKRIAYTRGSSGHGFLVQALARAGLSTKQVTLVDLTPGDSLAAFSSGSVDAWATWEPFISIAGGSARVLPAGSGYAASGLAFVAARNGFLADVRSRTAVRDYLVRLRRGLAWGATHQAAWAKAFNQESGLPEATALTAIRKTLVDLVPATAGVVSSEQKLADALAKAGAVKRVRIAGITSNQIAAR